MHTHRYRGQSGVRERWGGGRVGEEKWVNWVFFNFSKLNKNRTGESSQRSKAEDFQQEDEEKL